MSDKLFVSNSEACRIRNYVNIGSMITKEGIEYDNSDSNNYHYICIPQAA